MAESVGLALVRTILEVLTEVEYSPLTPMYLAFNAKGMSLDDFYTLMNILADNRLIKLTSETAQITDIGLAYLQNIRQKVCELN